MMPIHLLDPNCIRRVAILRALPGLGDFLCAVPALRALRVALPGAHVTLIGLPAVRPLVERFSAYVDHLAELPGFPGLPEIKCDVRALMRFLTRMHASRFDLAVQMHGSGGITNVLVALLGARTTAGFYVPGAYCPDETHFLPYPEESSEVWRNLHLMTSLGAPCQGHQLEFAVTAHDQSDLASVLDGEALEPGRYVVIHPGAKHPARRWPVDRFAALARALQERGVPIVLTGTAAEAHLTQAMARVMSREPLDLAGRTSLGALAALLQGAACVLCNDTGVSHLAAALRVPSVVLFTGGRPAGSDPVRWAPLDRARHRILCAGEVDQASSGPLAQTSVKSGVPNRGTSMRAGDTIPSVEIVLASVEEMLQKAPVHV